MNQEPITQYGYEKLTNEIRKLKEVELPAVIKDVNISASYGDLTENAEYEAATERQGFILTRLGELQELLAKSVTVNPSENTHNIISFGSTFKIVNIDTDEKIIYTLVGGYESEPEKGLISYNSPFARLFINKEVDDEVVVSFGRATVHYEIEKIYFDEKRILKEAI